MNTPATLRPLTLKFLIALNLGWSGAAFVYDWPALLTLPGWSIPFIIICPLYPLLLAGVWMHILTGFRLPSFFTSLALLGSTLYGIFAIIFYSLIMAVEGFSWNSLGQIFWVEVYAIQGLWLLNNLSAPKKSYYWASLWLAVCFYVQYITKSYGYLGIGLLPSTWQQGLFLTALACLALFISVKNKMTSQ